MHATNVLQLMLHRITSADQRTTFGVDAESCRMTDATSSWNMQGAQPNTVCKQEGDREIRCNRLFMTVSLGRAGTGAILPLERAEDMGPYCPVQGQGHGAILARNIDHMAGDKANSMTVNVID